MIDINSERIKYLDTAIKQLNLTYSGIGDFKTQIMEKHIEYAFSPEFYSNATEELLRESHPGLKDLYNQYQTMIELLRKNEDPKNE